MFPEIKDHCLVLGYSRGRRDTTTKTSRKVGWAARTVWTTERVWWHRQSLATLSLSEFGGPPEYWTFRERHSLEKVRVTRVSISKRLLLFSVDQKNTRPSLQMALFCSRHVLSECLMSTSGHCATEMTTFESRTPRNFDVNEDNYGGALPDIRRILSSIDSRLFIKFISRMASCIDRIILQ